jgi:hypothetical protein
MIDARCLKHETVPAKAGKKPETISLQIQHLIDLEILLK